MLRHYWKCIFLVLPQHTIKTFTHLKHQWNARREEGHKHKVVGQDGHTTKAAHNFQLAHTCNTNKGKNDFEVWAVVSSLILVGMQGCMYLTWFPLQSLSTPLEHPKWRWAPVLPCHEQYYPWLHPARRFRKSSQGFGCLTRRSTQQANTFVVPESWSSRQTWRERTLWRDRWAAGRRAEPRCVSQENDSLDPVNWNRKKRYWNNLDFFLLEARKLLVEEVDDYRAEYKAWEYCKKSSDACKRA